MPGKTSIEWASKSWNPVTGCSKVSPGCAHCYAETFAERWRGIPGHPYEQGFDLRLWPDRLGVPLRWRRPERIFVNSMSDLFHEEVPAEFIAAVFGVMAAAPQHTFLVLTKRPDLARGWFDWHARQVHERDLRWEQWRVCEDAAAERLDDLPAIGAVQPWPLSNVWVGTSIENRRFVGRADELRHIPAAVRFISAEPLLGPLVPQALDDDGYIWPGRNPSEFVLRRDDAGLDLAGIDWLIVGGESGPRCRPLQIEWIDDLAAAARAAATALFVKQLGGQWARSHRSGSSKGGEPDDWPERLRVRETPTPAVPVDA